MKINKIAHVAVAVVLAASLSGCHIYQKYDTPTSSAITRAYAEARS